MYKDKFAPNGAIVFIVLQIYFATRAILKLGNILGYSPVLAEEYSVTFPSTLSRETSGLSGKQN